ncbi:MAG: bifunctional phosphoglucose/phosphomannose isomerase, partial [Armatimonadetes bacterium]|nr:bifunctional phosphoglucose/phosphomannose isomerase [Armatimonadota bacterium]
MHQFDDKSFVTALDPKGMLQLYTDFPTQCETALRIAKEVPLPFGGKPDNVVLTGMGGSAAGGDFVRAIIDSHGKVPFLVNRDYTMPNWVGSGTLVFATSYSGNTEET